MADELDFGFPATSTRTSNDDFTTTTLTGFADASLDYTDSTHGGDAGPAHAAGGIPRFEGSDGEYCRTDSSRTASAATRRVHGRADSYTISDHST